MNQSQTGLWRPPVFLHAMQQSYQRYSSGFSKSIHSLWKISLQIQTLFLLWVSPTLCKFTFITAYFILKGIVKQDKKAIS